MRKETAYTSPGQSYPAYVNVLHDSVKDDVTITVRSRPKEDGSIGDTGQITMSFRQWKLLLRDF